MSTEETVSSTPRQRGAVSPRIVEGANMEASFEASKRGETTLRVCSSIIASAEQDVKDARRIPAHSLIREAGVSVAEPSD